MAALSKCIGCGICDAQIGHRARISPAVLRGPSDLVLGHTRSLIDWDAVVEPLARLEEQDLEAMASACPADVPFERLARIARRRAELLRAAQRARRDARSPRRIERHEPG
jgi:hypothetical protein